VTCVDRRPSAAIVGTRSATHYGRSMAAEIAGDLSAAGVIVVSGLAKGIDGAAHTGVLRRQIRVGEPVAVVGTGLDVAYPRSHSALWAAVSEHGAVVSEQPLGSLPRPGVFPARNRILAALSDVVVVIECHRRGGSLYTAEAAARRGIPVGAVPGSVRSPASSGCNELISVGCTVIRNAYDVLTAIDLVRAGRATPGVRQSRSDGSSARRRVEEMSKGRRNRPAGGRPGPSPASDEQRQVLEAMDDHPTGLETILLRTGLPIAAVALACEELVECRCVVAGPGWWARA
jgi:DNA processing protein